MTEMRYWTNSTDRPKKLDVLMPDGGMYYTVWIEANHSFMPPRNVLDYINQHPDLVRWDPEDPKKVYEVWLEDGPLDGEQYKLYNLPGARVEIPFIGDDGIYGEHVYKLWGFGDDPDGPVFYQYVEPPKPPKVGQGLGALAKALKDMKPDEGSPPDTYTWTFHTVKIQGENNHKPHPFGRTT